MALVGCSNVTGEPAYEMFESHPDWKLSLHLGHGEVKATNSDRHARQADREKNRREVEEVARRDREEAQRAALLQKEAAEREVEERRLAEETRQLEAAEREQEESRNECEVSDSDVTQEECSFCQLRREEINRLMEENRQLRQELDERTMNDNFMKDDDIKVKYYTGLPSYATFLVLLKHVSTCLPRGPKRIFTAFQMLLVTFMRLRLDLPVQHIAHLFRVDRKTVSSAFTDTLSVYAPSYIGQTETA